MRFCIYNPKQVFRLHEKFQVQARPWEARARPRKALAKPEEASAWLRKARARGGEVVEEEDEEGLIQVLNDIEKIFGEPVFITL